MIYIDTQAAINLCMYKIYSDRNLHKKFKMGCNLQRPNSLTKSDRDGCHSISVGCPTLCSNIVPPFPAINLS